MTETTDELPTASLQGYSLKGSVFRGYAQALQNKSYFKQILDLVPAPTKRLLLNPPLASEALDGAHYEAVESAVVTLTGTFGVRQFAKEALPLASLPLVRGLLEGFLRLFGTSPNTILSRLPTISSVGAKGIVYEHKFVSDRECRVLIRFFARRDVKEASFHAFAGVIEALSDLLPQQVTVSEPNISPGSPRCAAEYIVKW